MGNRATDAAACRRQKTAIAYEVGNIQGMSERFIAESNSYAMKRIPQGTYDPNVGIAPRKIRYGTAPIPDTAYIDPSVSGDEAGNMGTRDCEGEPDTLATTVNKNGAQGCNIPGQTIDGGYDEFGRILRAKAWETNPFCAFDLLLKGQDHIDAYITMLRDHLPMRAREQFEYQLERLVIENGVYNTSATSGWISSTGGFPTQPTGTLDVSMVQRLEPILRAQGWTGPLEIQVSKQAFEEMRMSYKTNTGQSLETTVSSNETHFLGSDREVILWAGIRWVIDPLPPRGFLRPKSDGSLEFVRVLPTVPRIGTGAGVLSDPNEDYYQCRTVCEGKTYELYEVGLYIHSTACQRQAFAMPSMMDKSWASNLFNFEVNMIDGPYITHNVDNFKGFFRILHAFGFESLWPERMGAIIYRVSPTQIYVNTPNCDTETTPALSLVTVEEPNPVELNEALDADNTACDPATDDFFGHLVPAPTQADPTPAGTAGVLQFRNAGPVNVSITQTDFVICVERVNGVNGAATCDIETTEDGSATVADNDFVAVAATQLAWLDGEAGVKCVTVTLGSDPEAAEHFLMTISNATGATLSADTQMQVNLTA